MIEEALAQLGPCLSTSLADYLVATHGLTADAARQRVRRLPSGVKRLAGLPFSRGSRFLYLASDFDSPEYWTALIAAIRASKGPYAMALAAVEDRGVVPVSQFQIVCGSPIRQKRHIFAETVLKRLTDVGVLKYVETPTLGECVAPFDQSGSELDLTIARARARIHTEKFLLDAVRDWARKLALASHEKIIHRGDPLDMPPMVGTFAWDLTGPSYLTPLVKWTKAKQLNPGFLVCDVLLNDVVSLEAMSAFLHKCKTVSSAGQVQPPLAIFIANRYSSDALLAARKFGIVPATPESLFGRDAAEAFRGLASVLTDVARGVLVAPERLDQLFSRLGKVEGAVGNMRGAFFELLVLEVMRRTCPAEAKLNAIYRNNAGEKAEVDVYAVGPDMRPRFIECKGIHPKTTLNDSDIDTWLSKRIGRVREHLLRANGIGTPKPIFELWVTGRLSEQAEARIAKTRQAHAHKFDLVVYGPDDIRKEVEALNDPSLLKTFEQHFLLVVFPDPDLSQDASLSVSPPQSKLTLPAGNAKTLLNAPQATE